MSCRTTIPLRVPKKMYEKRKKLSKDLGVTIPKTFAITDAMLATVVKQYKTQSKKKKERFIIDV